jgi:hypothetical protein
LVAAPAATIAGSRIEPGSNRVVTQWWLGPNLMTE